MKNPTFSLAIAILVIVLLGISGCTAAGNTDNVPAATVVLPPTDTVVPADLPPEITVIPRQSIDGGRIEFQHNASTWYTQGDLQPATSIRFMLSALQGQQMTVRLNVDPAGQQIPNAALHIAGSDGQELTTEPVIYWSKVLPTSQEYYIEVRSSAPEQIFYTLVIEIPATVIDPANGEKYEPISPDLCLMLQETAANSTGVGFGVISPSPFIDPIGLEAGQGCRIYASGDGNSFSSPQEILTSLVNSIGLGWTELPAYQADGPSGSTTALARDMALMILHAEWSPAMGTACPPDQPINDCNLSPEQKTYTVTVDIAQYRATFSLDGHWENSQMAFSLDLFQDWKTIYGTHVSIGQDGDLVDSLEDSINGTLQGNTVTVEFKSSYTDGIGVAKITYLDVNTIQWQVVTPPEGEYYLPEEAILTRK